MANTNLPPIQKCGRCGAEWVLTHDCPNAPRSTTGGPTDRSPFTVADLHVKSTTPDPNHTWEDIAGQYKAERDALAGAIVKVGTAANVIDGTMGLTGPQLLLVADDAAEVLGVDQKVRKSLRELLNLIWDDVPAKYPDDYTDNERAAVEEAHRALGDE